MRLVKGLLERCVEVVELLAERPMCGVSDIAAALDLPKSATHRLLQELLSLGWVEQAGEAGPYRLTLRFGLLAGAVMQMAGLVPILERLAARTRELVRLTVAGEDKLTWFACAQGAPAGLLYQPAMEGPVVLHATANGKAFLATLPDAQALAIARRGGLGQPGPTPGTLTSAAALLEQLALVRRIGYAVADEEAERGVVAVAVAVRRPRAPAVGTLSVAGPRMRVLPENAAVLAEALHETAAAIAIVWARHAEFEPRRTG